MKKSLNVFLTIMLFLGFAIGCTAEEPSSAGDADQVKLDNPKNRISYTIGLKIGRDFANQQMDVDPQVVLLGIQDAMGGKEPRLTEEEMAAEIQVFQEEMQAKAEAMIKEMADSNLKEGETFLAENATKEGVMVTESGLQYEVIEPGEGESPTENDMVTVHYRGTLIDGTQFDSSIDRGEPATFPVSGVIPGWTEALQLMKPGAKYRLYIPSELAYGERGAGREIGPNATLIFDVELLSVSQEVQ